METATTSSWIPSTINSMRTTRPPSTPSSIPSLVHVLLSGTSVSLIPPIFAVTNVQGNFHTPSSPLSISPLSLLRLEVSLPAKPQSPCRLWTHLSLFSLSPLPFSFYSPLLTPSLVLMLQDSPLPPCSLPLMSWPQAPSTTPSDSSSPTVSWLLANTFTPPLTQVLSPLPPTHSLLFLSTLPLLSHSSLTPLTLNRRTIQLRPQRNPLWSPLETASRFQPLLPLRATCLLRCSRGYCCPQKIWNVFG